MTKKEYVSGSETDEEVEEKAAPVPPKKVEKVGLAMLHVGIFFKIQISRSSRLLQRNPN